MSKDVATGHDEELIQIVTYDTSWPSQATDAIHELSYALPGVFKEIEHIGSTAVPGLVAKPVIDLMAAVDDPAIVEQQETVLARLGYSRHLNGMTDRLLYIRIQEGKRTHILHVVTLESWPTRNQRLLRDYLRTHPDDAARYAELKQRLVVNGVNASSFASEKTELIQELTDKAREELGLPSVSVWEK